jgi:uroporphyrinogen-III decarboxylase
LSYLVVCGNFDPVAILLQGDIQSVRKTVEKCSRLNSNNHIISAGCEVPKLTPAENLKEVAVTLRNAGAGISY